MKILDLLRNPLIRSVGVAIILYFALFADKTNPESLGNRLAPETIKKNFAEAKEKGKFIITNVKTAQEQLKDLDEKKAREAAQEKLKNSNAELQISCGDNVEISYGVFTKNGKQLEFIDSERLTIGKKLNPFLEKNIIGLKQDETRNINIPQDFQTDDLQLLQLLKNNSDLHYQVTLLHLQKTAGSGISCD